jgi:hypothetical protein
MAGILTYSGTSGTAMTLRYTPDDDESSAVLHAINYGTGADTTQAMSSGANTVTVSPGAIYLLVVAGYDGAGDLLAFSNFLFFRVPSTGEGDDFTLKWITDYDEDWQSVQFDTGEDRIRIPTNRKGHWFQWEISGDGQNQRLELRNVQLAARLYGQSMNARQS